MKKFFLLLIIITVIIPPFAGIADSESEHRKLLRMSSEELMTYGRTCQNPEDALLCFSIVNDRISEPANREEASLATRALNNCGHLYFHRFCEYNRSYSYFSKALRIARDFELGEEASIAYLNLGNLYLTYANRNSSAEEIAIARRFYHDGMELALKNKLYELAVLNFTNLCAIELDDLSPRRLPSDMQKFARTDIPENTKGLGYALGMYQGLREALSGNLDASRREIHKIKGKVDARYTPERYEYAYYAFLAKTFRQEQRWDSVLFYNRKIEVLAQQYHMPDVRPDNFKDISEAAERIGDSIVMNEYRIKYLEAKDSLLSIGHLNDVGNMRLLDRIDSSAQELKEMRQKQDRERRWFLFAIAFTALITFIAVILIIANRRLRQKNEALYNSNQQLIESEDRRRREILRNEEEATVRTSKATAATSSHGSDFIDETLRNEIIMKIERVFATPSLYCTPDFSLNDLVKACGSNTRYVSLVINDHYGHSFSQLLSDNRVKEACRRIDNDPAFTRLTVEAISSEMGFKSRVTFLTNFKRVTGLTPSQYIAIARKNHGFN